MNNIYLFVSQLVISQLEKKNKHIYLILCLVFCSLFGNTPKVSAQSTQIQITPDSTLPSNSVVSPDTSGNLIEITGGTTAGNNLFHSFQQFSVLDGQIAFFDNLSNIGNIFSRVTGGSVSSIEGIIRANGTANLFFINPKGIIFGPNATLEIGGSFLGSTADSIKFSDGSFYSAIDPQAPPLLTINIPVGLQYGSEPGNIIVEGTGNSTSFTDPSNNNYSLVKDSRPSGLQVGEGKNLALIGGNVGLDGGNLTAAQGHVELSSVKEGLVELDTSNEIWTFDYQGVAGFQDIALVNAASVEVSGNSSGTVNVRGQNISLTDASAILANTSGNGTGGSITLNGADSVTITGVSQNQIPFVSYVSTDTTAGSTGAGADLTIDTNYLLVAGGAQVASAVFGSGKGGNLSVNAGRIELISGSRLAGPSGLFAPIVPGATGDGGNINLETDSLLVAQGAQAFTLSLSSGKAGDFKIKAQQEIELNGTSPNGSPSGLFSNTFGSGDGGNLTIDTGNLVVADGADIGSTVNGLGTGGNIKINANTIELTGLDSLEDPSQISASIDNSQAAGVAGDITIETNSLIMTNGTKINSSVFGSGDGGNITIKASEIDLTGFSTGQGSPTAIFASVFPGATGNSGNVTIATDNLQVSNGAQIAVSTGGSGSGGNLTITASDSVDLIGNAIQVGGGSSGLFSSAVLGDGNGGNIDLTTDQLTVKDGATISASNFLSSNPGAPAGTGKAGNININAPNIELNGVDADTPASITASTFAGGGGNISLNSNTITAKNGAQVTAETSGEGAGGAIEIIADNLSLSGGATFSSSTSAAGDAGTISITSNLLDISSQGTISTSSTGEGQAGNINLNSDNRIQTNQGFITATSEQTGGGDINIFTDSLLLDNNSLISTSVLDSNGGGGNININSSNLILARNNSDIRANAVFGPGGNINITTELIFTDLTSDIDASSQFGLDGVVEINSPESEKDLGTGILPENITDPSGLITASCPSSGENVFAVTGNGGIPNSPYQTHSLSSNWYDLRPVNQETAKVIKAKVASSTKPIKEATATIINSEGELELVALTPVSTHNWVKSSCRG